MLEAALVGLQEAVLGGQMESGNSDQNNHQTERAAKGDARDAVSEEASTGSSAAEDHHGTTDEGIRDRRVGGGERGQPSAGHQTLGDLGGEEGAEANGGHEENHPPIVKSTALGIQMTERLANRGVGGQESQPLTGKSCVGAGGREGCGQEIDQHGLGQTNAEGNGLIGPDMVEKISGEGVFENGVVELIGATDTARNHEDSPGGVGQMEELVKSTTNDGALAQYLLHERFGEALEKGADNATSHDPESRGVKGTRLEHDAEGIASDDAHTPGKKAATNKGGENGTAGLGANKLDGAEFLWHREIEHKEEKVCGRDGQEISLDELHVHVLSDQTAAEITGFEKFRTMEQITEEGANHQRHSCEVDTLLDDLHRAFAMARMGLGR